MEDQFSNADAQEFLEESSDAFFSVDLHWNFTYLNKKAASLIMRDREALVGRSLWEEFPEAMGTAFHELYHQALREQIIIEFEEYYPTPLDCWYEVKAVPSKRGLNVYFRDITEPKKLALQREQHYKSLFQQNPMRYFPLIWRGTSSA
jgi:two-component system, sporulation sensor kinase A